LNAIDEHRFDEAAKEVLVADDYGMLVMYDASLDDMLALDEELLKIGTYYTRKCEDEFDFKALEFPFVDRFDVLKDLLESEFEFQFAKAKVVA